MEFFDFFGFGEGGEEFVEVAFHELGEVVGGEADAVVGNTGLRKVVGADAFGAVARAYLGFALGGVFGAFLLLLAFEKAGAEDFEGLDFVFELGTLVGAFNDEAGGFVEELDGGVGGVDALAAGAGGAGDGDFDFVGVDLEVHLLGFGEDGDGDGGGVNAAIGLGGGDALDAVDAAFPFEGAVNVGAGDEEDDFAEAAGFGGAGGERLDGPAVGFGVASVEAGELGGEEGGFVAPGAGADFDDGVAGIGGVGRQHQGENPVVELGEFGAEGDKLLFGEGAEVGIGGGVGEEGSVFGDGGGGFGELVVEVGELGELLVFAAKFAGAALVVIEFRRGHERVDFGETRLEGFDGGKDHEKDEG